MMGEAESRHRRLAVAMSRQGSPQTRVEILLDDIARNVHDVAALLEAAERRHWKREERAMTEALERVVARKRPWWRRAWAKLRRRP